MKVRMLINTIHSELGRLFKGDEPDVPEATARRWQERGIATTDAPAATTDGTAPEPEPEYTCTECGQTFKTEAALKGHVTRTHPQAD